MTTLQKPVWFHEKSENRAAPAVGDAPRARVSRALGLTRGRSPRACRFGAAERVLHMLVRFRTRGLSSRVALCPALARQAPRRAQDSGFSSALCTAERTPRGGAGARRAVGSLGGAGAFQRKLACLRLGFWESRGRV